MTKHESGDSWSRFLGHEAAVHRNQQRRYFLAFLAQRKRILGQDSFRVFRALFRMESINSRNGLPACGLEPERTKWEVRCDCLVQCLLLYGPLDLLPLLVSLCTGVAMDWVVWISWVAFIEVCLFWVLVCINDYVGKVESMLQLPQDPNLTPPSGETALATAVAGNHLEIARLLVEAGSRLDAAVGHARSMPLSIAVNVPGDGVAMVKFLLEAGASIDARNSQGSTALALAAAFGRTEVVRLLLLEGAGVDLMDSTGWTALTTASSRGHAEAVQVLLDFGSNVHHVSQAGTALTSASFAGHDAIVRLLLQHGAQVQDYAVFAASTKGHVNCVRLMLKAPGWRNVGAFRRRATCSMSLTHASRRGNVDLVQVLLEARADVDMRIRDFTALMEASLYSRVDVVRVLLKAGADKDATDRDGTTALMLASMTGHAEIVHMLLQAGADRNLVSKDGTTAMMEATSWGHIEVRGLCQLFSDEPEPDGGLLPPPIPDVAAGRSPVSLEVEDEDDRPPEMNLCIAGCTWLHNQSTWVALLGLLVLAEHLLSGKRASVEVEAEASVESLKRRAYSALAVPNRGRLLNSSGELLDGVKTITEAKLKSGDVLTLHVNRVQLQATRKTDNKFAAFAALMGDGTVVTWGAGSGGDSSAVQDQLRDVQQIQASSYAFAAIRRDGSVVTWGHAEFGGDSSAVRHRLRDVQQIQASYDVQQIQASYGAFAAILGDGSVVTWGHAHSGGNSSAVQDQLRDVQQIQASYAAFAAILGDGSVVSWGGAFCGGDSRALRDQLRDVQQIQASTRVFAAILGDGSVVTWGDADRGGDSRAVQDQLRDVQQIQATYGAFAAILGDGSVVTWGADRGGDSRAVQDQLRDVQQIQATYGAFAAILGDGSVVTWGDAELGADGSVVQAQLKNVQQIQATSGAFAAILGDGSVVTWGDAELGADSGGDSSAVQEQLKNVQQIQASSGAFAAILGDGSVVTWGHAEFGGDSSAVRHRLRDVQQIQASYGAFAAILGDGSVAVRYVIGCETCSRSKLLMVLLLQSWVMDPWSLGAMLTVVATAAFEPGNADDCVYPFYPPNAGTKAEVNLYNCLQMVYEYCAKTMGQSLNPEDLFTYDEKAA
eukprot:s742_g10.t3